MSDRPEEPRRPILGRGELLSRAAERVAGGGAKYDPRSFAEARDLLRPMVSTALAAVSQLPERLRGERIYFEAALLPNYLAASHHPTALEEEANLVVVGTRPSTGTLKRPQSVREDVPSKTLIFAATDASLQEIAAFLEAGPTTAVATDLIKVDAITLPLPSTVLVNVDARVEADGEIPVWEAVLQPPIDTAGRISERVDELIRARWASLITSLGGTVHNDYIRRVGDLTFMPVELASHRLHEVAIFNPLRSIKPMPRLRPIRPRFRSVDLGALTPAPPAGGPPADARIGVFDGGVDATHPLLAPYVTGTDLTTLPSEPEAISHGTLVTSALLYGHIQAGRALDPPPAHVDMFRIHPPPWGVPQQDEVYWALDRVVETLRSAPGRWRVVNLSYGPDVACDESGEIDRFTAELDQLTHELGVTFTIAAGNEGNQVPSSLGEDRVQAPADGVNMIGVGACDDLHPPEPVRAEYSCVGPGRPGLRVQPLGVAFGGSESQLFVGADQTGTFQADMGTSFAAPSAARGLATLFAEVPFSVNLARAFAAHFATAANPQDLCATGYGRLLGDYRPVLTCGDGEITVVVEDQIARGDTRAYPVPFPAIGLSTGNVRARWTISFTSPTDPADPVEYTSAGLEVVFRPNAALFSMSPPRGLGQHPRDVDIRRDAAVVQRLANQQWRLSTNPKSRSGSAIRSEQTLRDEGKWETVVRYEDGIRASALHLPEIWVTYYERERGQLVPQQTARPLRFVLVMTVTARGAASLYEQVLADQRFSVLAPLRPPVRVRPAS
jgi:Subtilase family